MLQKRAPVLAVSLLFAVGSLFGYSREYTCAAGIRGSFSTSQREPEHSLFSLCFLGLKLLLDQNGAFWSILLKCGTAQKEICSLVNGVEMNSPSGWISLQWRVMVLILLVLILLQCQWDFWRRHCVNTIIGRAINLGCFPILWGKAICGQICAGIYIHYSETGEALRLHYVHLWKWWNRRVSASFMIDIVPGVWLLKGTSGKESIRRWEDVISVKHVWSTSRGDRFVSSDNFSQKDNLCLQSTTLLVVQSDLTHWDFTSVFLQNGVVVQTDL